MDTLLYIYLFTASWNSAFAYERFNLPMLFAVSYVLSSFFNNQINFNIKIIKYVILPFLIAIFYYNFISLMNPHPNVYNYILAYSLVPLFLCYGPISIKVAKKFNKIEKYFFGGLLFIALVCIFESIIRLYFGFDITSLVPQLKSNFAFSFTNSEKILNRSRGFSTEPMIAGLFLSVGFQYSLINIKNIILDKISISSKLSNYLIMACLFLFAIITTGSASAFFISLIGSFFIIFELIYFSLKGFRERKLNKKLMSFIIYFVIIIIFSFFIFEIIPAYKTGLENIIGKIFLNKEFASVSARLEVTNQYLKQFLNDPIGFTGSPGSMSRFGSAINWYLTLLGDMGLLGSLFTLIPILLCALIAITSSYNNSFSKYDKLILILIPVLGLFFHGTFYSSPLWATIIVTFYL